MIWNTDSLFKSKDAFDATLEEVKLNVEVLRGYKGRLTESGVILFEAVDGTDNAFQELAMVFDSSAAKIQADLTFFDNEIMSMTQAQYINFFKDEPMLEEYRPYIENLYEQKQYKLTNANEEVLAALGEVTEAPYRTYSVGKATDMQFDSVLDGAGNTLPNSFALFEGKYEYCEDPVLRKNAYESFNKTLNQYKNTFASVYNTEVTKQIKLSKLRGYSNVTQMLLKTQKVTEEMYHRQINVIYNELAPHMRKFAGLLKDQLGLDKVHFYDLKAPLDTTFNPTATFDEAKEVILKSLAVMGKDYVAIIEKGFSERWIDYADNIGKSTGAFCASPYAAHPFILTTFQNNMRDAFTLTHELGHAGHFYLANSNR